MAPDRTVAPSAPLMRITIMRAFLLATIVTLVTLATASAQDYTLGTLAIAQPWTRATPPGAKVGGGYLTVTNKGDTADKLVSVTAPSISDTVQLHEMDMKGGIMTMRALPDGVSLPAGGKVEFKPGSYHVMFIDLKAPLKQGEHVKARLVFERAGSIDVDFEVGGIGQTLPMHHDMPM